MPPRASAARPLSRAFRLESSDRTRPGTLSWLRRDLLSCGRFDPPGSPEVDERLAVDVAGLLVLGEVIERVAAVGDLLLPVLALRRSEQRMLQARAGGRVAGDQRRPEARALPVAIALVALVGREQIHGPAVRADK